MFFWSFGGQGEKQFLFGYLGGVFLGLMAFFFMIGKNSDGAYDVLIFVFVRPSSPNVPHQVRSFMLVM